MDTLKKKIIEQQKMLIRTSWQLICLLEEDMKSEEKAASKEHIVKKLPNKYEILLRKCIFSLTQDEQYSNYWRIDSGGKTYLKIGDIANFIDANYHNEKMTPQKVGRIVRKFGIVISPRCTNGFRVYLDQSRVNEIVEEFRNGK